MNIYKFRAECEFDIKGVRHNIGEEPHKLVMAIDSQFPDVEVEIYIDKPIDFLREAISQIVDSHVMLETLAPKDEYTGIRTLNA